MADTSTMRLPSEMQAEAKSLAAIRGEQPAALVARAWKEFMEKHREEFAREFEAAAAILRNGDLSDLTEYLGQDNADRAKAAAKAARA